ncbi:MAG: glycosyltransferase [bacterium]
MEHNPKLIIGFITYGELTAKYLPYFLYSLKEQSCQDFRIIALDNTLEMPNDNHRFIAGKYPHIKLIWHGKNLGFAKGYNELIQRAVDLGAEYFLVLNPDMILEPTAIAEMVNTLDANPELGSVAPKVLKWDFVNKTKIIDTLGIKLLPGLRFYDLGQAKQDDDQFDQVEILGPSGCAGMYRLSALKEISMNINIDDKKSADKIEYFDELMFMYKEDCDLAYRLHLAGWESALVTTALVYHDRTVASIGKSNFKIAWNRRNKSKQVNKWSFFSQQVLFRKYFSMQNPCNKLQAIIYQLKMLVWAVLFERYLLPELKRVKDKRKEIILKKEIIRKTIKS